MYAYLYVGNEYMYVSKILSAVQVEQFQPNLLKSSQIVSLWTITCWEYEVKV